MLAGDFGEPGVALIGKDDFSKKGDDAFVASVECNVAGTEEQLAVTGFVQTDEGAPLADIVESLGTLDIRLVVCSGDGTELSFWFMLLLLLLLLLLL